MKFTLFRLLVFFVYSIVSSINVNSQQLSDEVSSKLNESDQKTITKADNLLLKGELILSKGAYPGDEQLLDMLAGGETKELKKYASQRIEATKYYKDANSSKFTVYVQNCANFWKKYTGDKRPLELVKTAEANSSQLYSDAIALRKTADKKGNLSEKISTIIEAENTEKDAIIQMQKVLFVYLNYPATYDQGWFATAEPQTPTLVKPDTAAIISKNTIAPPDSSAITAQTVPSSATQESALVQKDIQKLKQDSLTSDSSLYMKLGVKEHQIDQFNVFLQKKYPTNFENYIIDFQKIDYTNFIALRDAWYQYRFGLESAENTETVTEKPSTETAISTSDTIKQLIAQDIREQSSVQSTETNIANDQPTNKTSDKPILESNTEHVSNSKTTTVSESKQPVLVSETKTTQTPTNYDEPAKTSIKKPIEPFAQGFLFRVQIAASRIPLNETVINNLYSGSEKPTETFEDNWYKYTIGEFNTYREARQLRDATNTPGVFVVAYLNGKRIKITPAVTSTNETTELSDIGDIDSKKIEFRLQLLASKVPMSDEYVKSIYNGPLTIDIIEDEGWLKYSILTGNTLSSALDLFKTINIPGAFIVAYYNNHRLDLHRAIKLTKKNNSK